jgi:hypothetical protein
MTKEQFEEEMTKLRVLRDKADTAYTIYQLRADEADCMERYIQQLVEKDHELYLKGEKP